MAKAMKSAAKANIEDPETPLSDTENTPVTEDPKKDGDSGEEPKDPQEPAPDPIDIKDLKEKLFVTQVVTPETLDKDNLSTYVTQVAKASELLGKLK